MAEGVQAAGSVAEEAGLKFETFAAMVGKVSEVTRSEGSQIGNAMKTIMARISRNKSADEDVTDEDRSKASEAYASVGIQLYNDQGEYQDFGKTLDQLSAKWNTLTDAQRSFIAEASAGVRNVNVFNTMMKTYAESKELAQAALEDSDFIDKTQEKYEESLAARQQKLMAQTQEFWSKLLDTNVLNAGLEILTAIFDVASKIVGLFKNVGGIFGETGAGIGGMLGAGAIGFGGYKIFEKIQKEESIIKAAKGLGTKFGEVFISAIENKSKIGDALSHPIKSVSDLGQAAKTSISAMSGLSKAMLGLGATVAVISAITWAFDKAHESAEELEEKVKEANKVYESQQATLKANKATIDSIGADYDQLSRGVNDAGENVSLTTKEFERYHEVCNKIAEMYPHLVRSYDEQGNAILNLKDGVEALNAEYEKAAQLQAAEFWKENAETYNKNYNRTQGRKDWWTKQGDKIKSAFNTKNDTVNVHGEQYLVDNLTKATQMSNDELRSILKNSASETADSWVRYLMNELGATIDITDEELGILRGKMANAIQTHNAAIQQAVSAERMAMQQYLSSITLEGGSRSDLNQNIVNHATKLISNLPKEILDSLEDVGGMEQYVNSLLTKLSNNEEAVNILDTIYKIDDNTSFQDLKKILETQIGELAAILGQDKNQLKIQLGLEDEEELVKAYDTLVNKVNAKEPDKNPEAQVFDSEDGRSIVLTPVLPNGDVLDPQTLENYANQIFAGTSDKNIKALQLSVFDDKNARKEARNFAHYINKVAKSYKKVGRNIDKIEDYLLDNNIRTLDEIELLTKCVEETNSWTEALERFNLESIDLAKNQERLDKLRKNIEGVKNTINELADATEGSVSSMGMTSEQINNVVDAFNDLPDEAEFEYDKLFESTASGVHLNVQEMERLNGEYIKMQKGRYDGEVERLKEQYRLVCMEIANTTGAERDRHLVTREGLAADIREAMELQSQFEGATSAVTNFFRAQNSTNEGANYEKITKSIEEIEKLYNEGLVGTDDFKAAVQMMTNEDLIGASSSKYIEVYEKQFGQFKKYLTEGQEGVRAFLDTLSNEGFASVDENGIWTIDANVKDLAENLGLSESLIAEIFKRLNDYGFDIDFREETEYLKEFRKEAEKARESLKEKFQLKWEGKSADELKKMLDMSDDLRDELIRTFGAGSDEVKNFDKQVEYVTTHYGELIEATSNPNSADGIKELNKSLEKLNNIARTNIEINWSNQDPEYWKGKVDELTSAANNLAKVDGKIDMSAPGAVETLRLLDAAIQKEQELNKPLVMKIDTSALEGETQKAFEELQKIQALADELSRQQMLAKMGFEVDTTAAKQQLDDSVRTFNEQHPTVSGKLNLDKVEFDKEGATAQIQSTLNGITPEMIVKAGVDSTLVEGYTPEDKEADVMYGVDDTAIKEYTPEDKEADVIYGVDEVEVDKFKAENHDVKPNAVYGVIDSKVSEFKNKNHNISATVTYTYKTVGTPPSVGSGRGWAEGTPSAPKDETALVGELGPEMRVRQGRWELIGQNGAEFEDIKKGDIIFDANQTKNLLRNGKIASRGRAFAEGTLGKLNSLFKVKGGSAYADGNYTTSGALHGNNKFYPSHYKPKAEKEKDEFLETFDWIEIKIDRIERAIQRLDTVASSVYKSFSKRNSTLTQEFDKVKEEIALQEAAAKAYEQAANRIGLAEAYAKKVREGRLEIESITDEKLANQIKEYQDLYRNMQRYLVISNV